MGKHQQKKKTSKARHNPVRVPDSHLQHGLASGASKDKQEQVLPILAKLSAPEASDRVWACAAVTNLIQNDPGTRRLFQGKNVVGELITRLTDSVEDVVVEAAGALRNLCIDGGYDLCAEVYNKGVLSPLTNLIQQITQTLNAIFSSEPLDAKKDLEKITKRKLVFDLAENVITILWCLSETSNKALTAVNNLTLTPFLLSFLISRASLPLSLVTSAAQCLYVLTDDNPPAATHLRSDGSWINTLVDVVKDGWKAEDESRKGKGKTDMDGVSEGPKEGELLLKVLAAGTIRHISPLPPLLPIAAQDLDKTLFVPLLNEVLNLNLSDVSDQALELASKLPDAATVAAQLKDPKTDHKTAEEIGLEVIEGRLMTLQIGLEIWTGICSKIPGASDDDEEEEEVTAEDDDDELPEDMEMMADEDGDATGAGGMDVEQLIEQGRDQQALTVDADVGSDFTNPLPPLLLNFLGPLNLPHRLLTLAKPTVLSFLPINSSTGTSSPSPHPPTTALLSTIHLRALEALNNLFLSISFFVPLPTSPLYASPEWQSFLLETRRAFQPIFDDLFQLLLAIAPSTSNGSDVVEIKGQEIRAELLEACTGCLMGLAQVTRGGLSVGKEKVTLMISAAGQTGKTKEGLRCRLMGLLGWIALRDVDVSDETIEINRTIGTFLIDQLTSSTPPSPESSVVILNAIFDVYADENAPWDNAVFRQGGFLEKLRLSVSRVRGITRGIDKRKTPELRARADEAFENLTAYIKWRRTVQ
ncbi:Armadillo-type fold [Phaffia rhodozyma]|uniref:Armadillo-type fold n=1 Tax=Phaffia rhodozyma TaxID=264483 RepID=A0A0F7SUZ7_PHARH|nr:Armadillo-type fold [Phaffia rhodozyma]